VDEVLSNEAGGLMAQAAPGVGTLEGGEGDEQEGGRHFGGFRSPGSDSYERRRSSSRERDAEEVYAVEEGDVQGGGRCRGESILFTFGPVYINDS